MITAAEAIVAAERPVLYVGGGAVSAGVDPADLLRVAEAVQMPVVTTLMAKGVVPDSHPLCLGLPGMHGSKAANWALNRCDLLVACGSRFDDRVTGKLDTFAPGAKVVHMDVDPAEIDKNRHAEIPIVGSLEHVVPKLAEALESRASGPAASALEWVETIRGWQAEHPFRYRRGEPLKPEYVIERLRDLTEGQDVIWTTGVGQHQMWAAQYLRVDRPRRFITSGGLGTMGFGVPAAIGAKVGRPDATVINIDGDGCFQMTMQELATARMYGIGAIHVVINNGWLGMVRQWQELFHDERFSETNLNADLPDYVKLAESFGIAAFRCQTRSRGGHGHPGRAGGGRAGRDRCPRRPRGEGVPDGPGGRLLGRHDRSGMGRGRQRLGRGGRMSPAVAFRPEGGGPRGNPGSPAPERLG